MGSRGKTPGQEYRGQLQGNNGDADHTDAGDDEETMRLPDEAIDEAMRAHTN